MKKNILIIVSIVIGGLLLGGVTEAADVVEITVGGIPTLTICDENTSNYCISMMDRNLGAENNDITSTGSYGFLYQWGVNGGGYSPFNNPSTWAQHGLNFGWGCGYDVTVEERQGPCPEGYHVPTKYELNGLMDIWAGTTTSGSITNNVSQFLSDFKIPFVGYREGEHGDLQDFENSANIWSSTCNGEPARSLIINQNEAILSGNTSRHDALSVRCFKNEPVKFTATFVANGADSIGATTLTGSSVIMPNIVRTGWEILGRSTDSGATEAEYQTGETVVLSGNTTFYAITKKTYTATFQANGATSIGANTLTCDVYNTETTCRGGAGTITICNPSNTGECLTMSDRNLGAGVSSTGQCSYGYLYQRGNNYGFPSAGSVTKEGTQVDCTPYGVGNNYSGSKFIVGNDNWCTTDVNNLWGGAGDAAGNNYGYPVTNSTGRRGPCPEGYHVPSQGELGKVLQRWSEKNGILLSGTAPLLYKNSGFPGTQFRDDFLIPFAGHRITSANLYAQGSYAYLWSSSPISASYALELSFYSSNVNANTTSSRSFAYSVRCFKDSVLSYSSASHVSNSIAAPSITRTGRTILGRSTDPDATVAEYVPCDEIVLSGDTTFYAITKKTYTATFQKNGATSIGANTLTCDVYNTETTCRGGAGTITICNPSDTGECLTMMDRNLGASSAGTGQCSYGNYYQRGNNYGFPNAGNVTTGGTQIDCTLYGVGNNYSGSTFIVGNYDRCTTNVNNLWGGASDAAGNNYGYPVTNPIARRGPCPEGYHVPSIGELGKVLQRWSEKNGILLSGTAPLLYKISGFPEIQFRADFLIPFAGSRSHSNANLLSPQVSYAHLWSSSPSYSFDSNAMFFRLFSSSADADENNPRAGAYSVRCFKDSVLGSSLSSHVSNSIAAPSITRAGWTILGWSTDSGAIVAEYRVCDEILLSGDMTLYAITKNDIFLVFNSMGGTNIASQVLYLGSTGIKPSDPTRSNSIFSGWYLSGSDVEFDFVNTEITGNTTLYAHWDCEEGYLENLSGDACVELFTVTLNSNGGSVDTGSVMIGSGDIFDLSGYIANSGGYVFVGWGESADAIESLAVNPTITGDITLYAVYKVDTNNNGIADEDERYTITFDSQGGSTVTSQGNIPLYATGIKPGDPNRTGSIFSGWYLSGSETEFDFENTEITGNVTLYAHWDCEEGYLSQGNRCSLPFTATFYPNGADSIGASTLSGLSVQAPSITRSGRTVLGWSTNSGAIEAEYQVGDNIQLSGNTTFYAITKKTYTATFQTNGATSIGANSASCNIYNTQTSCGSGVGNITICNPANPGECLTMQDRNLGALSAGTGQCSYGNYYQRGNNYGFPSAGGVTTGGTLVDVSAYGPSNPFSGSTFIVTNTLPYDWATGSNKNNLWGGSSDGAGNNHGYPVTNLTDRKGPCPEGYHVPSAGELNKILQWWVAEYTGAGNSLTLQNSYPYFYFSSNTARIAFQNDFLIPFAGFRSYSNASLYTQGSSAFLWSSSLFSTEAKYLDVDSSYVGLYNLSYRAYALSVRCFNNVARSESHHKQANIAAPTIIRDGYEILGWSTDSGAKVAEYRVCDEISLSGDTTLYAITKNTISLVFDSMGGTNIASQEIYPGSTGIKPSDPTKSNSIFSGWYLSGSDVEFDFENTEITGNITLYAHWDCEEGYTENLSGDACVELFTVILNPNGGGVNTGSVMIGSGDIFDLSGYTASSGGYVFVGWGETIDATEILTINPTITGDIVLYAVYKVDSNNNGIADEDEMFTVTFDTAGGVEIASQSVLSGESITQVIPVKTGFLFSGWYYSGISSDYYVIDSTDTNYPQGCNTAGLNEPDKYCLLKIYSSHTYYSGTNGLVYVAPRVTEAVKDGYTAPGYCTGLDTAGLSWELPLSHAGMWQIIASNSSKIYGLQAQGSQKSNHYWAWASWSMTSTTNQNCRLDGACGDAASSNKLSVRCISKDVDVPLGGLGGSQYSGEGVTSDITLVAKWNGCMTGYTQSGDDCIRDIVIISFESIGGTNIVSQEFYPGSTGIKPSDPNRSNSIFSGWYLSGSDVEFDFENTEITGNITLYAHWDCEEGYTENLSGDACVKLFTVTLNPNGGSVDTGSVMIGSGDIFDLSGYIASKDGYIFIGWGESVDAIDPLAVNPTIIGDITLYAIYFLPTANFELNGADSIGSDILTGFSMIAPNIVRTGWDILGRSTNSGAISAEWQVGDTIDINIDTTFYAITKKTYTVTFVENGADSIGATTGSCAMYNTDTYCKGGNVAVSSGKLIYNIGTDITICDENDSTHCITMMDRNLGAITNDITNTGSYGNHYQWGNNYGFSPWESVTTSEQRIDCSSYDGLHPYSSSTYITATTVGGLSYCLTPNEDLWGNITDTLEARQGPCPSDYHVPSLGEWYDLVNMWAGSEVYNLYDSQVTDFQSDFKIPFAGIRPYYGGDVSYDGAAWLWSSTDTTDTARNFYMNSYESDTYDSSHTCAQSVRCFKNEPTLPASSSSLSTPSITREGWTVLGWSTDSGATQAEYQTGEDVILSGDVILYAITKKEVTITFDSNGGGAVEAQDKPLYSTMTMTGAEPSDPTRPNSIFSGWYLSGSDVEFDFENTEITGNTILYAHWDCEEGYIENLSGDACVALFTVTLNPNGGSVDTGSVMIGSGDIFDLSGYMASSGGYAFVGWGESADATSPLIVNPTVTGDITFYAVYKVDTNNNGIADEDEKYTITFDSQGGSIVTSQGNIPLYATGVKPSDPSKDRSIFSGWYLSGSDTEFDFENTQITGNIVLYAHWDCDSSLGYELVGDRCVSSLDSNTIMSENSNFEYGAITIPRPDSLSGTYKNSPSEYIIMDRNLGATEAGTGVSAYGYYYQYGNNYGFVGEPTVTGFRATANIDLTPYGPSNPYYSGTFITEEYGGDDNWAVTGNSSIWGKESIKESLRQGPCPVGWHIPTKTEWSEVVDYWIAGSGGGTMNVSAFRDDLKIPLPGVIARSTAKFEDDSVGSIGRYRVTSLNGTKGYAFEIKKTSYNKNHTNNLVNGYSLRCFKDDDTVYVVTYSDGVMGEELFADYTYTGLKGDFIPAFPGGDPSGGTGRIFNGWYMDVNGVSTLVANPSLVQITGDISLYAKWLEYVDEGQVNDLDIYFALDSGHQDHYTIMNRNMGADVPGTGSASYGYHYQWGNIYGFSSTGSVVASSTKEDASGYGPGNYFSGSIFITGSKNWSSKRNDDLWGDTSDTSLARQGPCPVGYHVPSAAEWLMIHNSWSGVNVGNPEGCMKLTGCAVKIQNDLLLPNVGRRAEDGVLGFQSAASYWTSTPSDNEKAYGFYYNKGEKTESLALQPNNQDPYARGRSVRCVKNMYNEPLSLQLNGGRKAAVSVWSGKLHYLTNPTKSGYEFAGWYKDAAKTAKIENGAFVSSNVTTLYAKWSGEEVSYTARHYLKKAGLTGYDLYDTEVFSGDTMILLSDIAKDDLNPCAEYSSGSLSGDENGPGEIVTSAIGSPGVTTMINLYYIRKKFTVDLTSDLFTNILAGTGEFECGQEVEIRAYPIEGYHFNMWEGSVD